MSADFFHNFVKFKKKSFRNTIRVSNSLDPDQGQQFVGPDLDPNCLQRFLAEDKSHRLLSKARVHSAPNASLQVSISDLMYNLWNVAQVSHAFPETPGI